MIPFYVALEYQRFMLSIVTKDAHLFRSLSFITCGLIAIILTGCASGPASKKSEDSSDNKEVVYRIEAEKRVRPSSQSYILKAQQQSPEQARSYYIQAAKYAIAERQKPSYVQAILNRVDASKFNSVAQDIELAKAYLHVEDIENGELVLTRLQNGQINRQFQVSLWVIKAQLESIKKQHITATRSVFQLLNLHYERLTEQDQQVVHHILWQHIFYLPQQSLQMFQSDFGPQSAGWASLASIIQTYLNKPSALITELKRWQQLFPEHTRSEYLPENLKNLLQVQPYQPKHIALLLPLSGKLQAQGEVIRNGFLAAVDVNDGPQITLLDSAILSIAQIEAQIVDSNIDFIVGPLLKDKVEEVGNSDVLAEIPTLYLNINDISLAQRQPSKYYYALAPEDEIDQAVQYFIDNELKHPAIIYADNSLGRRLAEHFQTKWREFTKEEAEQIAFKNKSTLGKIVQELLTVDKSQERIAAMERLFGKELESEARSREDIDAVYVIANSQQTRLIKPFFDVNVSVFGERLPIFASSRSYLVNETEEQKLDLNDLSFTEMPWLITSQDQELHQLYAQIGEPQTQLKKLFAFGHDAHQLISSLKQLTLLPQVQVKGLTGKLTLDSNNQIKRELFWSSYKQGQVIALQSPEK